MFGKSEVDEHTRHSGVSGKAAQVFDDDGRYSVRLHFGKHFLKAGSVSEVNTTVAVVDEKRRMGEAVVSCILKQNGFLRQDLSRVFLLKATKYYSPDQTVWTVILL